MVTPAASRFFAGLTRSVRAISAADRQLPMGGVQILVGIDCQLEGWIEQAAPDRLFVFGLPVSPARYLEQLRYLADNGAPPIELVFRSRAEAARFGRSRPSPPPPSSCYAWSERFDTGPCPGCAGPRLRSALRRAGGAYGSRHRRRQAAGRRWRRESSG